jgi:integrase
MSTTGPSYPRLPLQDLALAPASFKAYQRQLFIFLHSARLSLQQLLTLPSREIDHLLAVYIQHCYDTASYTNAAHAVHAVAYHRPELKGRLPVAYQCLRAWERHRQQTSHPPLTWELTVLIAVTLARSGFLAPAVAMLVAFDCYLRVGELTRLRRCDIIMPRDPRMGRVHSGMAVCLPRTKTGLNQSVTLQDPSVAELLAHWVHRRGLRSASTERIFDFSPSYLRLLMHNACQALGLGSTPYVPHSLRHGGATHDFLRTHSIEHVQFRGRWKSMESSRRYIQAAKAVLAKRQVPRRLSRLGENLGDSLVEVMLYLFDTVTERVPPRVRRLMWADSL